MKQNSAVSPLHSIQTRVSVAVLVIFLAILWSLSLYATNILRQDMERLLGELQFATVSFAAAEISDELDDRLKALATVARAIDPAILSNANAAQGLLDQRELLLRLFNAGVIAYRLDGTAIAEVPRAAGRVGLNYMDIDTIAAALVDGKSTIGSPVIGKKLRTPVFGMTVPIRDAQGRVIGALSGVTNLGTSNFMNTVFRSKFGVGGGYMLVSPKERLVINASDERRVMELLPPPGANSLLDRFIQGFEGTGIGVNPIGQEVLASAKGIPVAGWYIAVALPTAEAFAPIFGIRQRMLIVTSLLTLLAGALTWWVVRYQLAPMLAASRVLTAMSDDPLLMCPLPIMRQDEVGQLIAGFNRVLKTLEGREKALLQSESRLSEVVENVDAYIYIKDTEGRYLFVNKALRESFCVPKDAFVGQDDTQFLNDDTVAQLRRNDQIVFTLGKTVRVDETIVRRLTGRVQTFISVKVPLRDDTGVAYALWGISTDITERIHMENELRIAAIAFECQEGIVVMDADRQILRVNRAFTQITGYSQEEAHGKTTSILRSDRHAADFYDSVWVHVKSAGAWQGEMWHKRKSGEIFPDRVTITAVYESSGMVTHYVASFTDATNSQLQEQKRLRDETAHRVVLVREVHHRIKNNLQGITGLLRQYSQRHPVLTDTINQVIGQVQGISVVHGLQGHAETSSVRLCELTGAIALEIQSLWQTPVVVDIPSCWTPCVIAEPEAVPVALILNELILNAVKHGGKAHGRVDISVRKGAQADVVQISIANHGQLSATSQQPGALHSGLQLIASLMPRSGCMLCTEQQGDLVVTLLALEPPVISPDPLGPA